MAYLRTFPSRGDGAVAVARAPEPSGTERDGQKRLGHLLEWLATT
jgi:hypothetical protein